MREKATAPGQHLSHKAGMMLLQEKQTTVPTLSSRAVAQRLGSWEEAGITTESFTAFPGEVPYLEQKAWRCSNLRVLWKQWRFWWQVIKRKLVAP